MLQGGLDLARGDVRVMLVDASYHFDPLHEFLEMVARSDNGRSDPLTGKTFTGGVFNAKSTRLIATGPVECNALIVFLHTGKDSTARVIAYIDDAFGLPYDADAGEPFEVDWSKGDARIFAL